MSDRGPKPAILQLLERLNAARLCGDTRLADELDRDLDRLDRRLGYTRRLGFVRTDDWRVGPVRRERSA
jgi:hypothetical protein